MISLFIGLFSVNDRTKSWESGLSSWILIYGKFADLLTENYERKHLLRHIESTHTHSRTLGIVRSTVSSFINMYTGRCYTIIFKYLKYTDLSV